MFAGIWGTIAVVFSNGDANIVQQVYSIVVVGIFVFVVSFVVWMILKVTMGIRVDEEAEVIGLDLSAHGERAYDHAS